MLPLVGTIGGGDDIGHPSRGSHIEEEIGVLQLKVC